jgi:hypothetical protein
MADFWAALQIFIRLDAPERRNRFGDEGSRFPLT